MSPPRLHHLALGALALAVVSGCELLVHDRTEGGGGSSSSSSSGSSSSSASSSSSSASSSSSSASSSSSSASSSSGTGACQPGFPCVSTVAGTGAAGWKDGPAASAKFDEPDGVAVDTSGNLYIADFANHVIRKIDASGNVTTFAGSGDIGAADGPPGSASFNYPRNLTVDKDGYVYVADRDNAAVRKIDPAGNVTTIAGVPGVAGFKDGAPHQAKFDLPRGVAVDSQGNVFVADSGNGMIRRIDHVTGDVSTFAGNATWGYHDGQGVQARFDYPIDVAADAADNLYVADYHNCVIRKIDTSANVTTLSGSGLCADADGNKDAAAFNVPAAVAVDAAGNVYVAEQEGNRIRKVDPQGNATTLGGTGDAAYQDGLGGPTGVAMFYWPEGIAVDANGVVYVADDGDNRIRKIVQP